MGVWKSAKIMLLQKDSISTRELTLMTLTLIVEEFYKEERVRWVDACNI